MAFQGTLCGFEALKATVPESLASVSSAIIRGFYRLELRAIDAYSAGMQYGAEESKQTVYKPHRKEEDNVVSEYTARSS